MEFGVGSIFASTIRAHDRQPPVNIVVMCPQLHPRTVTGVSGDESVVPHIVARSYTQWSPAQATNLTSAWILRPVRFTLVRHIAWRRFIQRVEHMEITRGEARGSALELLFERVVVYVEAFRR